jgi:hypothetical protein
VSFQEDDIKMDFEKAMRKIVLRLAEKALLRYNQQRILREYTFRSKGVILAGSWV